GFAGPVSLGSERAQHGGYFGSSQPAMEGDRAQVVTVESAGELRQQGVLRISGNALDHELLPRNAQREGGSFLKELLGPSCHPRGGGGEQGVPLRVHGVLVEGDRQLDEEI